MIDSLFIVIFKASMYCQKTFIIVDLILTSKFLLKTNQNLKIFSLFLHRRDLVLLPNKNKYRYQPQ